jgi:hypothetical protein
LSIRLGLLTFIEMGMNGARMLSHWSHGVIKYSPETARPYLA